MPILRYIASCTLVTTRAAAKSFWVFALEEIASHCYMEQSQVHTTAFLSCTNQYHSECSSGCDWSICNVTSRCCTELLCVCCSVCTSQGILLLNAALAVTGVCLYGTQHEKLTLEQCLASAVLPPPTCGCCCSDVLFNATAVW